MIGTRRDRTETVLFIADNGNENPAVAGGRSGAAIKPVRERPHGYRTRIQPIILLV